VPWNIFYLTFIRFYHWQYSTLEWHLLCFSIHEEWWPWLHNHWLVEFSIPCWIHFNLNFSIEIMQAIFVKFVTSHFTCPGSLLGASFTTLTCKILSFCKISDQKIMQQKCFFPITLRFNICHSNLGLALTSKNYYFMSQNWVHFLTENF
jgi:hypothetical protein